MKEEAACRSLAFSMSAWARPRSAGKRGDALEQFGFEELAAARDHKAYLWGNPQMACVLLIGRTFIERGWDTEPGDELDVRDLPAHDGRGPVSIEGAGAHCIISLIDTLLAAPVGVFASKNGRSSAGRLGIDYNF
jgi:hypothetical protein